MPILLEVLVDCPECEWYPDRSRCSLCLGKERVTQRQYDQWLSVMQGLSRATSILWQGPDAMRAEDI